jgi:hypothetical protein
MGWEQLNMPLLLGSKTAGRQARPFNEAEDWSWENVANQITTHGTSAGMSTLKDAQVNNFTAASTLSTTSLRLSVPLGGFATGQVLCSSDNAAVATVDQFGNVTPVSAGSCNIRVSVPGLYTRLIPITVAAAGGQSTTTLNAFVSGSLGLHLQTQANTLISGKTSPGFVTSGGHPSNLGPFPWTATSNIFNTDGVTRNSGVWTGAVDLTCIPAWYPGSTNGVLIGPETALFAGHAGTSSLEFVDNQGGVSRRPVVGSVRLQDAPYSLDEFEAGDITVAHLLSPLPSRFTPVKLAPANLRSYLPAQYGYRCCYTNQERVMCIGSIYGLDNAGDQSGAVMVQGDAALPAWGYPVRTGDSGSPVFILVNGSLVLLSQWHYSGAGPIDFDWISQINAAAAQAGSPDQVTVADFSGFPTY